MRRRRFITVTTAVLATFLVGGPAAATSAPSVRLPTGRAGDVVYFPTVQTCVDGGETAWIEMPTGDEELEHPPRPSP